MMMFLCFNYWLLQFLLQLILFISNSSLPASKLICLYTQFLHALIWAFISHFHYFVSTIHETYLHEPDLKYHVKITLQIQAMTEPCFLLLKSLAL